MIRRRCVGRGRTCSSAITTFSVAGVVVVVVVVAVVAAAVVAVDGSSPSFPSSSSPSSSSCCSCHARDLRAAFVPSPAPWIALPCSSSLYSSLSSPPQPPQPPRRQIRIARPTTTFLLSSSSSSDRDEAFAMYDERDGGEAKDTDTDTSGSSHARWQTLHPTTRERIASENRARAIRNKKKREPIADKKRRAMMFYKKKQQQKRRASRIARPRPFNDRIPLTDIGIGDELDGVVISLTNFGAYVDVGTECDGLLHVGQLTREFFVEHPREVLKPGQNVTVRVVRVSPELKKIQLSMLDNANMDPFGLGVNADDDDDDNTAITLDDLSIDDELWGEIRRVTAYGAYVELGAEVDGFLHFMDHPEFGSEWDGDGPRPPSDYMFVGDRVRVWVSDLDKDKVRIKLTANRPVGLPGPRREMRRF